MGFSILVRHNFCTEPGLWFNIKMSSYQYRKSHCGDKTILRPSYLHNGISYTGKMIFLYRIGALGPGNVEIPHAKHTVQLSTSYEICIWFELCCGLMLVNFTSFRFTSQWYDCPRGSWSNHRGWGEMDYMNPLTHWPLGNVTVILKV